MANKTYQTRFKAFFILSLDIHSYSIRCQKDFHLPLYRTSSHQFSQTLELAEHISQVIILSDCHIEGEDLGFCPFVLCNALLQYILFFVQNA